MRKIDKPTYLPEEVFRACISRIKDTDLKDRLELCETAIILAAQELETKAMNSTLHTISVSYNISGHVSGEEMEKVYTDRMVKKNSPGRMYYDKLISSPANGRCPLCGQRVVSTLDHYLPKAHFPSLAIAPLNLVPSCKDCNKVKMDKIPQNGEEETLHPYFDNVDSDVWLKCIIIEKNPASLKFFADPPNNWGKLLSARVRYHFEVFELAALYGSHAADELLNIRHSVTMTFKHGGMNAVRAFLYEAALSRSKVFKNSWQTAMYMGLANNVWYCNGGFNL